MEDHVFDEHYEDEFEFPLLKLIMKRAEEKDISYVEAAKEVVPEYIKTIRYRDTEFEDLEIQKRANEISDLRQRERKSGENQGD